MKITVYGMTMVGRVLAAVLAAKGHTVRRVDFTFPTVDEPGLSDLEFTWRTRGTLGDISTDKRLISDADVVWVGYDIPVDSDGFADVDYIKARVAEIYGYLRPGQLVLISSQVPVGTTAEIAADFCASSEHGKEVQWGYVAENMRVGKAVVYLTHPDRWVIGLRHGAGHDLAYEALVDFNCPMHFMEIESAELVKNATNAWLAMNITFANEIARVAHLKQADAGEVWLGLKTDDRMKGAPLRPGEPYSPEHLGRDIAYLNRISREHEQPLSVINAVPVSNYLHRDSVI
jgi:UDPglucose 6-dehydrogenase